jgi:hypothetical protein
MAANDTRAEPLTESAEELAKRFAELSARWKEETQFSSFRGRDVKHPACREIIAMGEKAIPLILADLEKKDAYWFLALHEMTGVDPLPTKEKASIDEMAAAWLAWGHQQGYRW